MAYEKEKNTTLKSVITKIDNSKKIAVLIGPEGGIDDLEITLEKSGDVDVTS